MDSPAPSATAPTQSLKGHFVTDCSSAKELWDLLAPREDILQKTIYRGQADAEWKLVPRVLRANKEGKRSFVGTYLCEQILKVEMQLFSEAHLLMCFVQHCDRIGLAIPNDSIDRRDRTLNKNGMGMDRFQINPAEWPDNDWIDIMALAQHHGLPTRLLDWSRRSWVAAYFAASDALRDRKIWKPNSRLAVWALESATIEPLTTWPDGPVPKTHPNADRRTPYRHHKLIPHIRVITVPGATSNHLAAQAGLFTVQKETGNPKDPLKERSLEDDLPVTPGLLRKLTLPVTEASKLLALCELHDITATTIFRSYDGAARAVLDSTQIWSEGPLGTNSPPVTPIIKEYLKNTRSGS